MLNYQRARGCHLYMAGRVKGTRVPFDRHLTAPVSQIPDDASSISGASTGEIWEDGFKLDEW